MINLFVTYRCNLSCNYCFARELRSRYPSDLQWKDFQTLLAWIQSSNTPAVAFLGGEPTLHPRLLEMVDAVNGRGISCVLFTNGLCGPEIADQLSGIISNFVVNYNLPSLYTRKQQSLLHDTLSRLREQGASITFSKTFTSASSDNDYFFEGAQRYGVHCVRYDISRPGVNGTNAYTSTKKTKEFLPHVVAFARKCEENGLSSGLDCCLRLCDLSLQDRSYLKRISMKFTGICHPSIDLHPDLSASYCLPLHDVRIENVTDFADRFSLMNRFSQMVRQRRYANVSNECYACPDFQRLCQGGCMAVRGHETAPYPHHSQQEKRVACDATL